MKKMWLWLLPFASITLCRCTKDPLNNLTEDESRIYITNYDTSASFSSYNTFFIADSVAVISNNQLRGRELTAQDQQFINAVAAALQQRGYTRLTTDQNADLGVTVSIVNNTSTQLVSYPDYGSYYYDYWDPYYWGYPGYDYYFPTYYGVYRSTETALSVDMIDLKNAHQNNQLRDVWSGLVRGGGIFNSQNVSSQINALFSQSPYLKH